MSWSLALRPPGWVGVAPRPAGLCRPTHHCLRALGPGPLLLRSCVCSRWAVAPKLPPVRISGPRPGAAMSAGSGLPARRLCIRIDRRDPRLPRILRGRQVAWYLSLSDAGIASSPHTRPRMSVYGPRGPPAGQVPMASLRPGSCLAGHSQGRSQMSPRRPVSQRDKMSTADPQPTHGNQALTAFPPVFPCLSRAVVPSQLQGRPPASHRPGAAQAQ